MLRCEYCGNHMVYKWKEGDVPACDKCGALLQIDITDKAQTSYDGKSTQNNSSLKSVISRIPLIGKIALGVFVCSLALPFLIIVTALAVAVISNTGSSGSRYETESAKNSIYVEEIGRTCYLDGEDWYDSQTKCWFYN